MTMAAQSKETILIIKEQGTAGMAIALPISWLIHGMHWLSMAQSSYCDRSSNTQRSSGRSNDRSSRAVQQQQEQHSAAAVAAAAAAIKQREM
jgi:hypothetical protein